MAQHKIYNIKAGLPFSKILAQHLLHVTADQPELLTQYKVLLPTRRACRILRETFLSINEGKPLLLPQLTPLGDVDEEDLSLMMFGNSQGFLDIPNAIAPLKRQLLLAKLIRSVPGFVQGPDHALALAGALAKFIDQVVVEELSFSELHKIVPDEFASHWQITLNFLKIISENWPAILAEHNVIDVAERRNLLLQALAIHWQETPPDYPVIAAGSTGSIPAAGRLLGVISQMPTGQVVLPGLDMELDDEAWSHIGESHPQHGFKTLLERIGAHKSDIEDMGGNDQGDVLRRNRLASEMMLPAQVTVRWKEFAKTHDVAPMLEGLQYFPCNTQQEEAALIALMMRESLQHKTNITALVTPDRALARRVSALCRRWNIEVDDSAGQNLVESRLGKFITLSMQVSQGGFDVIALLSLLKMSYCMFGQDDTRYNSILTLLETQFLRQGHLFASYEMLREKIAQKEECDELLSFVDAFYAALKPLGYYARQSEVQNFSDILKAHIKVLEALATTQEKSGAEILWRGDVGQSAALFLTELSGQAEFIDDVTFVEYTKILVALMRSVTVRSAFGVHPRLLILGQLEARLSDADLVILGGLNEGTWPPDAGHDPWMSRPMRNDFGLPGSDQSVGIAAHDFVQGFCANNVVLTRSEKVGGSPTVPARWLDRLDTLLQGCNMQIGDLSNAPYLYWVKAIDDHDSPCSYGRPEPRPPISVRPNGASVTKIDVWMKDPYAIYMYYVLRLRKIRPLVQDNDAALRGTILHEIIERFTALYPLELPDDAEEGLINIARNVLAESMDTPDLMHYWWPRFLKIAAWFVAHEKGWRNDAKFLESEIKGNIDIDVDGQAFNLYGTADRVDRMHGGYALIDYKTGGSFSKKALTDGALPQLPLEALILAQGGFAGKGFKHGSKDEERKSVPRGDSVYLGYWKLTGGTKAGEVQAISGDLDETIDTVLDGLKNLISVFRDLDTPFYAVPNTNNAPRFNDYEHVSRLKEWVALDGEEGGG